MAAPFGRRITWRKAAGLPAAEGSCQSKREAPAISFPHRKKPLLSRGLFPVKLSIPSAGRYGFCYPRKAMDSFH